MYYSVSEIVGGKKILAGAGAGRHLLSALITAQPALASPTPVFLDFKSIEVATASYLRESVIGFRNYCRHSIPNAYPICANLSDDVLEELEFFVKARGDVLWVCNLKKQQPFDVRLIGDLDPAQRATFDAAIKMRSVTATSLAKLFAEQQIGVTAWNNRLSALTSKGVLMEHRQGKTKSFSPPLEIE